MVHESPSSPSTVFDSAVGVRALEEPNTDAAAASSVAADMEKDASAKNDIFLGIFEDCF
jgi:hypothetical protein